MQINFMLILSFFYGSSGRRAGRGGVAIVRGCSRTKRKIARRQVFWGVPFRYVCVRSRGISRLRSARSPRWRVFWDSRVRLVLFLMQGISRLTLEMTSCTFCFIMLFCKYRHRRLAYGGSPSGGDEERPYLFLLNITPSTATQQLTAYNGAEKQYSTPLRLFSSPPADDKPLLIRKKMHKTNFMQNIQYKMAVYAQNKTFSKIF